MADETGWNIDTLKEHLDALRIADQRALDLQAAEYGRRLEDLNHAREEAQARDGEFIGREAYEQRHDELDRRLQLIERTLANFQGRIAAGAIVLAVAVALITALVSHTAFA